MALREDGRFIVSYSEISKWYTCPRQWQAWYQMKAKDEMVDIGQSSVWGNSFHDCVEDLLVHGPDKADWLAHWGEGIKKLEANKVAIEDDFRAKVEKYTPGLISAVEDFLHENYGDYTILGVENEFEIPIEDMARTVGIANRTNGFIKGLVDLTLVDGSGKIWLLDWKTTFKGWGPWKRRDHATPYQLQLYKVALISAYARAGATLDLKAISRVIGTEYVIVKPTDKKPFERFPVSAGPTAMAKIVDWAQVAVSNMQREGAQIQDPTGCRFCPVKGMKQYCTL